MRPRWSLWGILVLPLSSTVTATPPEQKALVATTTSAPSAAETSAASAVAGTTFNGLHVPPMPMLTGDTLNKTIKEGNWYAITSLSSPYPDADNATGWLSTSRPIAIIAKRSPLFYKPSTSSITPLIH
jgi:hypothetical protein